MGVAPQLTMVPRCKCAAAQQHCRVTREDPRLGRSRMERHEHKPGPRTIGPRTRLHRRTHLEPLRTRRGDGMTDDAARYEYPPEWRPRGVQTPTRQTAPKDVLERLRDGELRSGCPNPTGSVSLSPTHTRNRGGAHEDNSTNATN